MSIPFGIAFRGTGGALCACDCYCICGYTLKLKILIIRSSVLLFSDQVVVTLILKFMTTNSFQHTKKKKEFQ